MLALQNVFHAKKISDEWIPIVNETTVDKETSFEKHFWNAYFCFQLYK